MFDMDQPPFICRWKAIAIVAALPVRPHAFGCGGARGVAVGGFVVIS
jgi:hypothetical protein